MTSLNHDIPIAIHTEAIGGYRSGGILCIVKTLNEMVDRGYDCRVFVNDGNLKSEWLDANFSILDSNSNEYKNFDGILISPFSPTAQAVNDHLNARHKFYWVHTNEAKFAHNGPAWQKQASQSYSLPNLKIFCTSSYLQILMEHMYNRKVIGITVPGGVDRRLFTYSPQNDKMRVGYFHRDEEVRGIDTARQALNIALRCGLDIEPVAIPPLEHRLDVASAFMNLDVYIDASRLAGFPIPVLEAMSCGTIPICTYYGTTDVVLHGYNGFIVPTDNPDKIFEYIETIYTMSLENRIEMALAAHQQTKFYTWSRIVDRFEDALIEGSLC